MIDIEKLNISLCKWSSVGFMAFFVLYLIFGMTYITAIIGFTSCLFGLIVILLTFIGF